MKFKIEIPEGSVLCAGIYSKTVFGGDEQKRNKDDIPLWNIRVLNGIEPFNVTVASNKKPGINQGEPVSFENLEVHVSKKNDIKLVWFTADSVKVGE